MSKTDRNGISLDQDGNLIFQSYLIIELLIKLRENNFISSDYFSNMNYNPFSKELLKKVDIDNQGMLMLTLYALLVIPKEILQTSYVPDFEQINIQLSRYCQNTETNYSSDSENVDYIRHLRNAVAHGRISFVNNSHLIFEDEVNKYKFKSEIPLARVSKLINELQEIHRKYLEYLKANNTKQQFL
jgi:hypothetical protein